jgi:hypothetical protein
MFSIEDEFHQIHQYGHLTNFFGLLIVVVLDAKHAGPDESSNSTDNDRLSEFLFVVTYVLSTPLVTEFFLLNNSWIIWKYARFRKCWCIVCRYQCIIIKF